MRKALIVGGGVAGPVTAIALRRAGFEVVVCERYDRGSDGVGAYLTLAVNGLAALRTLELSDRVRAKGFDTPEIALSNARGRALARFPNGGALADGTVSQTITRSDLYEVLRDEAVRQGAHLEYGKDLVDAESTSDGVVARFADGTRHTAELLVGADGLHSRTRRIIDPAAPKARYVGLLNTGGYTTGVTVDSAPGVMNMIFGKRCFFCYIPDPGGRLWWFANPRSAREMSRDELSAISPEQWRARLIRLFDRDSGPAADIVRGSTGLFPAWNTYDFPSVPTWHNDRMIVLGDAAHATSPAAGQGAAMAIEDAVVLAKCLRDIPDVPRAFDVYARLRRDRVESVVAQGKKNGDNKAVGPFARIVRDLMMPLVFKLRERSGASDGQQWMYDYRIDWDTPVQHTAMR